MGPGGWAAIAAPSGRAVLAGWRVVVTSGPTREPIDPVRYIANRSSGAQGSAIAAALVAAGAEVAFVTGPAEVPPPEGVEVRRVETAAEMMEAALAALPADAFVAAAAVADWSVEAAGSKLKKGPGGPPALRLRENGDVLATVSRHALRPSLVVGFAAETGGRRAPRHRQAAAQGLRLDRGQRRLARRRRHGRGPQRRDADHRGRPPRAGRACPRGRSRPAWPSASPGRSTPTTGLARMRAARRRWPPAMAEVAPGARPVEPVALRVLRAPGGRPAGLRDRGRRGRGPPRGARRPRDPAARRARGDPHGRGLRDPAGLRGADPTPLGARAVPRRHRAQRARHDRRGLPRLGRR